MNNLDELLFMCRECKSENPIVHMYAIVLARHIFRPQILLISPESSKLFKGQKLRYALSGAENPL